MKTLWIGVIAGLLMASGATRADEGADLAKTKECLSCHALDKEVVGPAFKSVARKYKGKASAEDQLVRTVVKGSSDSGGFHWGTKKMPAPGARVAVTEDEARVLVRWVLAQ
ncbi:c-type cytochrome [Zoogloea sp. LCSB751]|uniref:c-type cytochrome n=1 Tax=Zoogloea sp. LCSB751 TaxID=1965277 RepID=UPI0009A50F5B|nr:c-type cytochrome [Zoogloea sp. LCSB751]